MQLSYEDDQKHVYFYMVKTRQENITDLLMFHFLHEHNVDLDTGSPCDVRILISIVSVDIRSS